MATISLAVDEDGDLSGTSNHSEFGPSIEILGKARAGGAFRIYYRYPTSDPEVVIGVGHENGRLRFETPNRLVGTLKEYIGDFRVPVHYDLTKQ